MVCPLRFPHDCSSQIFPLFLQQRRKLPKMQRSVFHRQGTLHDCSLGCAIDAGAQCFVG
jgi:hypothetical protein